MNISCSAITHPPKHSTNQKAIDQFIGSQAFITAARVGHVCAAELDRDEDGNPERDEFGIPVTTGFNLFTNARNALIPTRPTIAYKIEGGLVVGQDPTTGENIAAPRIVWDPTPRNVTSDQAVSTGTSNAKREKLNVAKFLKTTLAQGPMKEKELAELADAEGISLNQLKRAKREAKVESKKKGFGDQGYWEWKLIPRDGDLPF